MSLPLHILIIKSCHQKRSTPIRVPFMFTEVYDVILNLSALKYSWKYYINYT